MLNFYNGEKKYINFCVCSRKNETVVVTSAKYTLEKQDETVLSGDCEIDGNTISVLLEPPDVGTYTLAVTYTIPPETRIAKEEIDVYSI